MLLTGQDLKKQIDAMRICRDVIFVRRSMSISFFFISEGSRLRLAYGEPRRTEVSQPRLSLAKARRLRLEVDS
jgi:hypothetical protein